MPDSAIIVVGELTGHDGRVREVLRQPLRQGVAPRRQLRDAGYRADVLPQVSVAGDGAVLTYGVRALPAATRRPSSGVSGVVHADVVRQRLAAYAVVTSSRGVLLTQLSRQTGRPGLWILPGGGVDPGEHERQRRA